jgi:hypothetical protein
MKKDVQHYLERLFCIKAKFDVHKEEGENGALF